MVYDFRSFTFSGCHRGRLPDVEDTISASVGQGGKNLRDDTVTIQSLLNNVPAAESGPQTRLAVDGLVGGHTIAAIRRFQMPRLGWADGRVDPDGPTLALLRGFAASADISGLNASGNLHRHAPSPAMFEMIRRASAISVLPEARRALHKAQLDLDLVSLRLTKDTLHIEDLFNGGGPEQRPFRILYSHFAIAKLSTAVAKQSLDSVRQTFADMRAILDGRVGAFGGDPWGMNVIENDPITVFVKELDTALAYTPTQTGNRARQKRLGISPFRIYFTNLMDGKNFDHYLYTVLHELAHFVDDEKKLPIDDHAYGWQDQYLTLPHEKRIHNAECYSACAFELALGNPRLANIYPKLRVLEIDPVVIR